MKTTILKTNCDPLPYGNTGDVCFRPKLGGGYNKYILGEDVRWHIDGCGQWRMHKSGEMKNVPYYAPLAGYTKEQYAKFLEREGFTN